MPNALQLPGPTDSDATLARAPPTYLPADVPSFRCASCTLEVALQDELVSRQFSAADGAAFLVRSVVNTQNGPLKTKQLMTGKHTIADLVCTCSATLGWSYFSAPDATQRYKEGKHILEKSKIYKDNKWT